jgi:hypothetical protein
MASAGHTWVVDHTASFTLTNLLTFDGVFVGGDAADTNVLIQYVEAGGNVYVFSGGTAANALWNDFVIHFGLEFTGVTSGETIYPIVSTHPIFSGVDHLYGLNGASDGTGVADLEPSDPRNAVVASYQGTGLFAVWDGLAPVMSIRVSATQGGVASQMEVGWTSRSNWVYQLQDTSPLTTINSWTNLGSPHHRPRHQYEHSRYDLARRGTEVLPNLYVAMKEAVTNAIQWAHAVVVDPVRSHALCALVGGLFTPVAGFVVPTPDRQHGIWR